MIKKITSLLISIVIISISLISFASSTSDLNNKKSELENQIKENKEKINDIEDEVDSVMSELEKLNISILQKEDELDNLNAELSTLNSDIEELKKQLEEEQTKYDEQYDLLCKRLVAQYKMGNASYLDVLLNSKSLTDFISKYYIIGKIAEYDTKLLKQIEEQKNAIENSKAELEKKQNELSEKQAKLKLEEITLSNKKANKNKYISQLNEEQKALQIEIDKENEQLKKVDNELAAIARQASKTTQSGYVYTGGKLAWPCPGYSRISSNFGYRSSPGGIGSTNHKGLDMAAPNGTSILAAESGTVIKVSNTCTHNYPGKCGCGGGYGNYVMISHGNGLVTLYAHCSSILVSTGQNVTVGQQVGGVGNTGNSTGFHLHFGVLINGNYVNPAPYLGM